jgi:purine-cytosine permease-like protein
MSASEAPAVVAAGPRRGQPQEPEQRRSLFSFSRSLRSAGDEKRKGEYEREPVPEGALRSWVSFLAIFTGRHTAGTEFTIGPLFVVHGAKAIDVVLGLFIGNILATLTWRFVVAPLAMRKRLTTFYLVERVCGAKVRTLYSLIGGLILAVISGAMFAVSGTAVGVLFDVQMPGLNDFMPNGWTWVAVVVLCGAITSLTAAFGFDMVSRFSMLITPYMIAVVIYFGVRSLQLLEVDSVDAFWKVANEKVWTGQTRGGYSKYSLGHCVCAAWFCDLVLHFGQIDQTLLRYGRTVSVGWCSASGMFVGHYFTWIVAGLLYAVQLQGDPTNESVAPGPMAKNVAGINGLVCIILAGWSTANPCMYEAGLAMQSVLGSRWSTPAVTLGLGVVGTVAALFPVVVMMVLEVLAFGGLLLLPVGVVLVADTFVLPRLGLGSERCADEAGSTNWPAAAAWAVTMAVELPPVITGKLAVFFAPLVGIPLAALLYVGLSCWSTRRSASSSDAAASEAPPGVPKDERV